MSARHVCVLWVSILPVSTIETVLWDGNFFFSFYHQRNSCHIKYQGFIYKSLQIQNKIECINDCNYIDAIIE